MKKKKTVAYLTRHAVSNYGSVLQAYATQTALEKLGANACLLYTSPSPRDRQKSRMPSSA